jgi:subtilase-type serine protease
MNHPLHGRSSHSRSPLHSRLALAVSSSLLLAAALPAMASESLDAAAAPAAGGVGAACQRTCSTDGHHASGTSTAVLGNPGDAASWRSDEFNADWGLGAMGADYAYARGLTGKGVRLALFDSGSALAHPEFAGRNTSSITIGPTVRRRAWSQVPAPAGRPAANSPATTTTASAPAFRPHSRHA